MATSTVTITGDKEVQAKLQALGAGAQSKLLLAIQAGALIIQTDAKIRAPKLTGNLARSIHSEVIGPSTVAVGTDVVYAAAQEYGRPDINLPAQPYLRPAVDQNLGRIGAAIEAALKGLLGI